MVRSYPGIKQLKGDSVPVHDALVVESPFIISINQQPFTVTMQTPGSELELAIGLLVTEGVLPLSTAEIPHYDLQTGPNESRIDLKVDSNEFSLANKRSLMSIAACGICGKTDWKIPEGDTLQNKPQTFHIQNALDKMFEQQQAFHASGGLHAAALFDEQENLLCVHEDIGRHNAVDKCIGELVLKNKIKQGQWLLVSGRISYEIIAKCFKAKIPNIAAVSAPSSLAVDFAKEWGIQLWGFCREGRQTQYA